MTSTLTLAGPPFTRTLAPRKRYHRDGRAYLAPRRERFVLVQCACGGDPYAMEWKTWLRRRPACCMECEYRRRRKQRGAA